MKAFCSALVAIIAVGVGLILSPVPTRLGVYRWLATRDPASPMLVGFTPAMNYGVEWGFTFDDLHSRDLTGQKAIVTGANSGVGFEIAKNLAKMGASVTMACRNEKRCNEAADSIRREGVKGEAIPMTLDTSSLKSVKEFADSYLEKSEGAIDMLFLNAGTGGVTPPGAEFVRSEDGIELVFATNVVGHHLLYKLLEPRILQSKVGRVVLTASNANYNAPTVDTDLESLNNKEHTFETGGLMYAQSKLAQIVWAKKLTRHLGPDSPVFVNSAHPGFVKTSLLDNSQIPSPMKEILGALKSSMWLAEDAVLTLLYLGVATDDLKEKDIRGSYYHPVAVEVAPNPVALDIELQDKLWVFLDELVKDYA